VWHVAGPPRWFETSARIDGWRAALADAGVEAPPLLDGDWSARGGYEAGLLLARLPSATAVFAANDHTALGLIRAFAEHGRRVPHDVSVVGFDDVPESAYFSPQLTTVPQDFAALGRQGLARLNDILDNGPDDNGTATAASALVIRSTTGPHHAG
jgi:DNA-binding LacI/PurR family transcriptional regulator